MPQTFQLYVAAAAALLALGAQASDRRPSAVESTNLQTAADTPHKLKRTYIDAGGALIQLPAGGSPVGNTLTVVCPIAEGCVLAANMNAKFQARDALTDVWIHLVVDGETVDSGYEEVRAGGLKVAAYQAITMIAAGSHTAEMRIGTSHPGVLWRWNKEFKLYTP